MVQCNKGLVQQREVIAAVLLPAILIRVSALRLFLAVADGLERVRANAILLQGLLAASARRSPQSQVVLGGTAVITSCFQSERASPSVISCAAVLPVPVAHRTQVRLVIVEENVFDHLGKELIVSDGGRRGGPAWVSGSASRSHRNLRCSFLSSGSARQRQMMRGGLRRRDGLRSAGINLVAVQGERRLRFPCSRSAWRIGQLRWKSGWLKVWR